MSQISIVNYNESQAKVWDTFVEAANNGTLFHKRSFLNYHPPERFIDDSLMFFKGNRLLAVFPAACRKVQDEKILISHPGASFGSFVFFSDLCLHDATQLVNLLVTYARSQRYDKLYVNLAPTLYMNTLCNDIEFALYQAGFHGYKRELSHVIHLIDDENRVLELFTKESCRKVRRAQKLNVLVREDDDFSTFYDILQQSRQERFNIAPTHSLEELQQLAITFPEAIKLFSADVEKQMVAGMLLFIARSDIAMVFYVTHKQSFQSYRPLNLLTYEICCWCIQNGIQYLDFGNSTINMEVNWGLTRFKESFGAQGIFRDSLSLRLQKNP